MFIGHFAVAFAAKRAVPTVSLGTLFVACELVDLLWPIFVLLGIETVAITPGITAFTPLDFVSYPWTHSLLMCSLWHSRSGSCTGLRAARCCQRRSSAWSCFRTGSSI